MIVPSTGSNGAKHDGGEVGELLARGWASLPPEYAIPSIAPTLDEARNYCKRLATSHYENFSVATWFLPKELHQHFYNVYAYCRISDDLGDEVGDTQVSLALLDRWEQELDATYRMALRVTLRCRAAARGILSLSRWRRRSRAAGFPSMSSAIACRRSGRTRR